MTDSQRQKLLKFDEVGYWSEIKLDIVKSYATEYSKIVANQNKFRHWYVDAFAGAGMHKRKGAEEWVLGSPLNALQVRPEFSHYYFIDLDGSKVDFLRQQVGDRTNVTIAHGDCNDILLRDVYQNLKWENYMRGLILLDPYGLSLNWSVIKNAGELRTCEIFLNFPIMDMNRNVLWNNPEGVDPSEGLRLTAFWGDDSWKDNLYDDMNLFGVPEKKLRGNELITDLFRKRLKKVSGFGYVPKPLAMRNSTGAVVYYLYFASQNETGSKIVNHIFDKYRNRQY